MHEHFAKIQQVTFNEPNIERDDLFVYNSHHKYLDMNSAKYRNRIIHLIKSALLQFQIVRHYCTHTA